MSLISGGYAIRCRFDPQGIGLPIKRVRITADKHNDYTRLRGGRLRFQTYIAFVILIAAIGSCRPGILNHQNRSGDSNGSLNANESAKPSEDFDGPPGYTRIDPKATQDPSMPLQGEIVVAGGIVGKVTTGSYDVDVAPGTIKPAVTGAKVSVVLVQVSDADFEKIEKSSDIDVKISPLAYIAAKIDPTFKNTLSLKTANQTSKVILSLGAVNPSQIRVDKVKRTAASFDPKFPTYSAKLITDRADRRPISSDWVDTRGMIVNLPLDDATPDGHLVNQASSLSFVLAGTFKSTDAVVNRGAVMDGMTNSISSDEGPANGGVLTIEQGTVTMWYRYQTSDRVAFLWGNTDATMAGQTEMTNQGIIIRADGRLVLREYDDESMALNVTQSNVLPWIVGSWYHVAVTWNGGERSIYLNGNLVAQKTYALPFSVPRGKLVIGAHPSAFNNPPGNAIGAIDEVGIWARPLSAGEIATIHAGQR